jgi:hypothetical protein
MHDWFFEGCLSGKLSVEVKWIVVSGQVGKPPDVVL